MKLYPIFLTILVFLFFSNCKKNTNQQVPLVTTTELSAPGDLSIISGGRIYEEGSDTLTEVGVCWSKTDEAPTTAGQHKKGSAVDRVFQCTIDQLDPFTNYFVRAYATNKYGTSFGTTERINSGSPPMPPNVQTIGLQKMTTTSISLLGKILSKVNLIKESGICWNTTGNPTVNDNRETTTSLSDGSYTCTIAGLAPNSIVFARAYAVTAGGTSYGAQIIVRSYYGTFSDHEGNTYFTTLIDGKEWMAENLRCTTFIDGTEIPQVLDNASWSSTNFSAAYCPISNGSTLSATEGLVYNSAVVSGALSIAPAGWHLPSKAECENLINFSSGNIGASKYLLRPKPGVSLDVPEELTAFDAKLHGFRTYAGHYSSFNLYGYFHTSEQYGLIIYSGGTAFFYNRAQGDGYCIRLVRD